MASGIQSKGPPEEKEPASDCNRGELQKSYHIVRDDITPTAIAQQVTFLTARFGWDASRCAAVAELIFGRAAHG